MVDSRKRATASLKVKYKSATLGQFTQQFGLDISHAGMFIKTRSPLAPATLLRLELQLSDATPVIQGSGRVRWRRLPGPEGALPAGMGIEFIRLEPSSRSLVDRIVDAREGRPSRFEQTDGAEHISASQPLPSSLDSSIPPPNDPSLPPMHPSPAPGMPPPDDVAPAAPPPQVAAPAPAAALPTYPAGLFATSGLRPSQTLPGGEFGTHSSFFSTRPDSRPLPSLAPARSAPPVAAPAAPPSPALLESAPSAAEPRADGDITTPLGRTDARPALDAQEDDGQPTTPMSPPNAEELAEPLDLLPDDEAPSGSSPPIAAPQLTLGLSSLTPPPRSRATTVVWLVVIGLALAALGLAYFVLQGSAKSKAATVMPPAASAN